MWVSGQGCAEREQGGRSVLGDDVRALDHPVDHALNLVLEDTLVGQHAVLGLVVLLGLKRRGVRDGGRGRCGSARACTVSVCRASV